LRVGPERVEGEARESFRKDDTFVPFSNGFEYEMWLDRNCRRGKGGCRKYKPNASSSRHGCPIEVALAMAAGLDGEVKVKHGLRGGFLEPGDGGSLVRAEGDPSTWECPEYQGPDDPSPPRQRLPRPPGDQLDIFDPRNAPETSKVGVHV
jgi:hypothetical protein